MRSSLRRTLLVFLIWFAGLGAAAQFAKIAVPFAQIAAHYPHVGTELGWLLSLVSLIGAMLGIVAGGMVGRFGAKNILVFGMGLGAIVSLWQASFPIFPLLLFSRVVEGISHLAIVVAAPTLIAQISTDRFRGAAMTLWSSFFGVAFAMVAWLGMPLVTSHGLGGLFVTHGVLMLVIAGLLAFGLERSSIDWSPRGAFELRRVLDHHRRAYRSPEIAAPGIGWLFYTLSYISLIAILPQQLPAASSAWVAGLMPLVSIATSLLIVPALLLVTSSVAIIILGFACAIAIVILALSGLQLAVVAVALFAALGLVQGASFSAVPELNKTVETQALGYGVLAQTGNIGNLLGTPLLLGVLATAGEVGMFWSVALIYAVGILSHVFLHARRKRAV